MSRGLLALAAALTPALVFAQAPSPTVSLGFEREATVVRSLALEVGQNRLLLLSEEIARVAVADPAVADLKVVTPTQVLLTAKGVGTTDLTLWNRANRALIMALQVTRNIDALRKQLKELFPGEAIAASAAGDLVVLTGEASDIRVPERAVEVAKLHAKQVANFIKVTGNQQVQIEVRFAEVRRSGMKEVGLNLFQKTRDGKYVSGMFGSRTIPGQFLNTEFNPAIPGTGPRGLAVPGSQPPDVPWPQFQNSFSFYDSAST